MKFPRHVENLIANFRGVPENRSRAIMRDAYPIDSLLEVLEERYQIGKPKFELTLMENWPTIVGEFAKRAQPVKLDRRNRLIVAVADTIVRRELMFRRTTILGRIHALPDGERVKDLFFVSG